MPSETRAAIESPPADLVLRGSARPWRQIRPEVDAVVALADEWREYAGLRHSQFCALLGWRLDMWSHQRAGTAGASVRFRRALRRVWAAWPVSDGWFQRLDVAVLADEARRMTREETPTP